MINLSMRVNFKRTENGISGIANFKKRHSEPCKPQEAEEADGGFEGARAGDFLDFAKDVVCGSKEQIVEDFEQCRFIVLAGKVSWQFQPARVVGGCMRSKLPQIRQHNGAGHQAWQNISVGIRARKQQRLKTSAFSEDVCEVCH